MKGGGVERLRKLGLSAFFTAQGHFQVLPALVKHVVHRAAPVFQIPPEAGIAQAQDDNEEGRAAQNGLNFHGSVPGGQLEAVSMSWSSPQSMFFRRCAPTISI